MVPALGGILPRLLVAGVLPVAAYALLRPHLSSAAAGLALITVFPIGEIVYERVRHGRFDPIGVIALIGIGAGLLGAVLLRGDATLLKVRESLVTGLFGAICLMSLATRRPVMFPLARSFSTGGDPVKVAEFNGIWDRPGVPARFRFITALWGVALVTEAVVRTVLALKVPTTAFLAVSPVLNVGVIVGLLWYTRGFARRQSSQYA
jgi:hypothetical protein